MFLDRRDAGRKLSRLLQDKKIEADMIVSLPRGGTVVGDEIAKSFSLPHALLIVKKIGAPNNPELALGATGSNGIVYWDRDILDSFTLSEEEKEALVAAVKNEVKERERRFGAGIPHVAGKRTLIVDDGVATGATAIAASLILSKLGSKENILVTSVISKSTAKECEKYFDRIITAELPHYFRAVGEFYRKFPQVSDEKVKEIMAK